MAGMAKNRMKIVTNFSQFPELKLDEQQIKNCIRKHFGTIKAPIYLYVDHNLKTAHGLHATRDINHYKRLPADGLKEEAKKNKNHFHKISLSYQRLCKASKDPLGARVDCREWNSLPKGYRFFQAYFMTLLSHELQHARQVEYGIQYKRHNWLGYDKWIEDKVPTEYDACMAEFKKADKMLRSYCER